MINWFGPTSWGAPICESTPRVPAPVGAPCLHCEEPIAEADSGITMPVIDADAVRPGAYHLNCHLRLILGSVGHQMRRCHCFGGDVEDPPHLTRRQAADAAVAIFWKTQR